MYRSDHKTTTLPRSLREELGVAGTLTSFQSRRTNPGIRKERRKAARVGKKTRRPQKRVASSRQYEAVSAPNSRSRTQAKTAQKLVDQVPSRNKIKERTLKSISKPPKSPSVSQPAEDEDISNLPQPLVKKRISQGVKDKLAADDAEIAALEKALGWKDKKQLPKSFEDDGLDVLLNGLGDERKLDEGEPWLENKRNKARRVGQGSVLNSLVAMCDSEGMDSSFGGQSDPELDDEGTDVGSEGRSADGESDDDFDSQESNDPTIATGPAKKGPRENPYKAPITAADAAPKYVPPSLRNQTSSSETEDLSRLRRQLQGLINRLSEANMNSILGDVESLCRNNPRQQVSSTLLQLLLGLLSDPAILQDTFIILHAGFIAALYKIVGPDFGAQVVQRIDEEFRTSYDSAQEDVSSGKQLTNLASLLSALYTFQVVGSKLMYDYIQMFIEDLSEDNAELLLKILRNSGPQLRRDDPSALKEIVILIHKAVGRIGEKNLSVRTKFMIETIDHLKNNRMKTGIVASTVMSEHVTRMKKTLGSLNTRNVQASEPLRIGLRDIRGSDKRGKWWLIGASYRDATDNIRDYIVSRDHTSRQMFIESSPVQEPAGDQLQMARAQGMNTDVRRKIFLAIMDASDFNDAFQRLIKPDLLNSSQQREIPRVVVHCAGVEEAYNPYYTLLARRLCSHHGKFKKEFQLSLRGLFKRLGEGPNDDQDEVDEALPMKTIVNLAKMYGTLVAQGGLTMDVLKVLNFAFLQPKASILVELMIITTLLHSQKGVKSARDENKIAEIFAQAQDGTKFAKGLQYFLRKTVSKTDVAGTKADTNTVRWGCKVARSTLDAVISTGICED
ncbi:MAG: hypothetical protein Q9166_000695 [cf. Caloplaca sp. 2 TL-2023]